MPKTQNKASSATVYRPTTSKASKQKHSAPVQPSKLHTPHAPDPLILHEDGTVYSTSTTAQKFIPELILSHPQKNLWLYRGDCLALLDAIAHKYPQGHFGYETISSCH